jgi:SAM-dependent methyltransferase
VGALDAWGEWLRSWAIPEEIMARAPESPWGFVAEPFVHRAERAREFPPTISARRALEALPEGGGVLDVGSGAGAASLGLVPPAGRLRAVDPSQEMLDQFRRLAADRGVRTETVCGVWPDVAGQAQSADVVVCHHVLYNVTELEPFVRALTAKATRRVVVEITGQHPTAWMSDLWMRFHRLRRPERPTADDAEQALRELRIDVHREQSEVLPDANGFLRREDEVAFIRKRLCLRPDQDDELIDALSDRLQNRYGLWTAHPERQPTVTLWWDS